jgi:prophage regulatory protein
MNVATGETRGQKEFFLIPCLFSRHRQEVVHQHLVWSTTMQYLSFTGLQAKLGGRGRTTIYRDVDLGRLPKPIKIGSRLYWNEADIDATLKASTDS